MSSWQLGKDQPNDLGDHSDAIQASTNALMETNQMEYPFLPKGSVADLVTSDRVGHLEASKVQ